MEPTKSIGVNDLSRLVYLIERKAGVQDFLEYIRKEKESSSKEKEQQIIDILDGMEDKTARNVVLFHLTPTKETLEDKTEEVWQSQ